MATGSSQVPKRGESWSRRAVLGGAGLAALEHAVRFRRGPVLRLHRPIALLPPEWQRRGPMPTPLRAGGGAGVE